MISTEKEAEKMMFDDALTAYPDECCGFMFGSEEQQGKRIITTARPVYNSATENRKRRFVIAPKDYMDAEQFAINNDVQLLGIYHSHPSHRQFHPNTIV